VPKKVKDIQMESAAGPRSQPRKIARKRSANPNGARKRAIAKSEPEHKPPAPSEEEIRIRAYFIAERRAQYSIKGDHHGDWLEARRQLFEEAGLPLL
jgi:hypothetical protein